MKKEYIAAIAIFVIAAGAGFYGGVKYDQNKTAQTRQQRVAGFGIAGANGTRGMRGGANGAGFTGGQIISKDDKSITIKTQDGGSKIVFLAASTKIDKSVAGAVTDLSTNQQVTVTGAANSDGSITAQTIQIRPQTPTGQ